MNKNRLYLSGGGNEKQSFPLDKFFFSTLPLNGRFLYIPVALRGHMMYPTAAAWMKSVTELHERADIQFETADDLGTYDGNTLRDFSGIYIGGGNTWSLMQELRDSGFADILIDYIEAGGHVYGGSAGAIIMGKRINTQDDENKLGMQDVSGLNLLNGFSVACHFKNEQGERFQAWAIDNNLPVLCLPEETGLVVEKDLAHCIGTEPCTVYRADGTPRETRPGESFQL